MNAETEVDEASLRMVAESAYFAALEQGSSPEAAEDASAIAVQQYQEDCRNG